MAKNSLRGISNLREGDLRDYPHTRLKQVIIWSRYCAFQVGLKRNGIASISLS